MLRERHVRRPVGRQHEQPHLAEAAGQIVQHVDRGDVRPMQVVEEEDERPQLRRFQQERAELALHSFLRHGGRVLAHPRDRVLAGFRMRHLHVPRRRDGLDERGHRAPRRLVQQAVERLEQGQIRLGAGEPLRAAAAHDERTFRQLCELRQEVFHEDRLPDSRLAHHRQEPAAALARCLVGPAERRPLVLAPDRAALGERGAALKRRLLRVPRGERRQCLLDLARRRTQRRILRDHPVHEFLDRGRHRRVQPRQRHGIFQQDRRQHRRHRRRQPTAGAWRASRRASHPARRRPTACPRERRGPARGTCRPSCRSARADLSPCPNALR